MDRKSSETINRVISINLFISYLEELRLSPLSRFDLNRSALAPINQGFALSERVG